MSGNFLLFLLVGLAVVFYIWYTGIIKRRNQALEALSTIDVQLKQRFDLLPNILTIAKKFMEHEKGLLTEITELRSRAMREYNRGDTTEVKEHLTAVQELSSKMSQFMLNVENYPNLKSDQTMIQAMQTYNEVEGQIAAARRFYNSTVTELNNSIQIFPGNVIANMIGVKSMPFYQAEEAAKVSIDASKILG